MNARIVRSLIVFLAFLCRLVAGNSQANCRLTDCLSGNGIAWNFRERNGHRAEQVWKHSRKELKDSSSDAVEIFDRYLPQAITDLPLQAKKSLLDCLRKKNFYFHASRKEVATKTQFIKHLQLLHALTNGPRRYLKSKPRPRKAPPPPTPRYDPKTLPSPAKNRNPSVRAPPVAVMHSPPVKKNATGKYTIAAIAAAFVAMLAAVVLILFCCLKVNNNKTGPLDGQRDGKPLQNVSSSYKTSGVLEKSQAIENLGKKVSTTPPSMNIPKDAADSHDSSLTGTQSVKDTTGASGNSQAPSPLAPGETAPPPPRPPPPPPPKPPAPNPPPPPKAVRPPPMPPKSGNKPSPPGARCSEHSSSGEGNDLTESGVPKTKLKPFFWDKVLANPDHSMVWHDIKAGSFQFNEEMMENLFGYTTAEKNKNERNKKLSSFDASAPSIQLIDAKKSQNLAILLRSLHVKTEEVCDALKEGNELPAELVEILLKMAPTTDEELKIRLFSGELSELGPAEQFLKVIVDIPFAFQRLESLLFMGSLQEQVSSIMESFATLEVACKELRNSRLFLKLLEAVLKTGNRMNDGTLRGGAQAFKLDTLLKLSDVKGTDGKTTLLHFVVQEIIRSEGIRAARTIKQSQSMSSMKTEDLVEDSTRETAEYYRNLGLKAVSGLGNDLENVRKAALVDGDALTTMVSKLGHSLAKTREFLNTEIQGIDEKGNFRDTLAGFVQHAEVDIKKLLEEEKRIMALVKSTADYFHGDAGKDEGLRLFVVVREFLVMLDKTCTTVRNSTALPPGTSRKEALTASPSQESRQPSMADVRDRLFPAIKGMRMHDSSDDETYSP